MSTTFRKICRNLHLWLGLVSGLFVFIICVTGGLYVFKDEIEDATQPWRFVKAESRPVIKPGRLITIANRAAGERKPSAITYGEGFDAVKVDYWSPSGDSKAVWLNPYSGRVIKVEQHKAGEFDFFNFILRGHRTLWLPRTVGNFIVDYSVLVFFIVLVTGLVIWLPRRWNRKAAKARLTIRRPLKASRLPFDLHNVVGFYALLPLVVLCFTGLMFGLQWFSRGVYAAVSGGGELQDYVMPQSDTLHADTTKTAQLDALYVRVRHDSPGAKNFYLTIPQSSADIYRVSVVHKRGSYYRTDNLFYDQYTLAPLEGTGPWAGRYSKASVADKMMRMNIEIHDGRILGVWGKIIMFLASAVGASLPITGFILWRKRKRGTGRKKTDK